MPDAKDTGETRVAGTGSIYIATASAGATALPSSFDATLDAATWVELGYTDEDGVTFKDEPTIERKGAWQSFYPVRILETARMAMASFNLEQWNTKTLRVATGGGTVSTAGTGRKFTPHAAGTVQQWALVIDVVDGAITDRYVIPNCIAVNAFETNLTRTDLAKLPVELEAIGEDGVDPWHLFTSDATAFAADA